MVEGHNGEPADGPPDANRLVLVDLWNTLGVEARRRPARFDHRLKQAGIDYWLRAPVRS
jgi:hypothetical protein